MNYEFSIETQNIVNKSALFTIPNLVTSNVVAAKHKRNIKKLISKLEKSIKKRNKISMKASSTFEGQLKIEELDLEIEFLKEKITNYKSRN